MSAFESVCRYFEEAAGVMDLSSNMKKLLLTPEREVKVQVATKLDNGEIATFVGFRIQHNTARGPMKGGLRFHPEVDAEEGMAETVVDLNVEAMVAKIENADEAELAQKREAKKRLDAMQEKLNKDDEFGSTYAFDLDDDLTT